MGHGSECILRPDHRLFLAGHQSLGLPDHTLATQGFNAQLGDFLQQLGAENLGHGGQGPGILAGRQGGLDAHLGEFQRQHIRLQGGKFVLPYRVFIQRAKSGLLLLGHQADLFQHHVQARRIFLATTLEGEQVLGHGPAVIFRAHPVLLRYPHIVEEHLALLRHFIQANNGLDGDAGQVHV